MDISAMIEDLEVEGYFASTKASTKEASTQFHEGVRVVFGDLPVIDLMLPLQGKDFLAGFEMSGTKSSWLVLVNYGYLEVESHKCAFQRTSLKLSELIKVHLINSFIELALVDESEKLAGYILQANKHFIDFLTTSGKILKVPKSSIALLAVEKLSIKTKV
jgi:hypothetical protein